MPLTWAAFEDYRLRALTLTDRDIRVIQYLNTSFHANEAEEAELTFYKILYGWGWLNVIGEAQPKNRERMECEEKLARLGLWAPWAKV